MPAFPPSHGALSAFDNQLLKGSIPCRSSHIRNAKAAADIATRRTAHRMRHMMSFVVCIWLSLRIAVRRFSGQLSLQEVKKVVRGSLVALAAKCSDRILLHSISK